MRRRMNGRMRWMVVRVLHSLLKHWAVVDSWLLLFEWLLLVKCVCSERKQQPASLLPPPFLCFIPSSLVLFAPSNNAHNGRTGRLRLG